MDLARITGGEFFRIGVFWDVGDCQIPDDCDPRMLYERIEDHLTGAGYSGDISFWAYKDTIPDELMRRFSDAGIMFKPDVPGNQYARVKKMLVDILLLASESRAVNLLVLSASQNKDTLVASVVKALVSRKFVALIGHIEFDKPVTWISNWPLKIDQFSERIVNTSVGRGNHSVTGTGIFWDIMDYPIPADLDAESVYLTIGTALCNKGHLGDVSIWAYGDSDMQTFPEDSDPDSRFRIGFVPDGGDYSRGFKMLLDMLFWALDNPKDTTDDDFPTLFLLSKDVSKELDFARVAQSLENRYYHVRVSDWLFTCLLDQEGTKVAVSTDDQADDQGGTSTVSGRKVTVSTDDQAGTSTVSGRMRFGGYEQS